MSTASDSTLHPPVRATRAERRWSGHLSFGTSNRTRAGERQADRGSVGCGRPLSGRRLRRLELERVERQIRDDVRAFVKADTGTVGAMTARLIGSPDIYAHAEREPERSINFVTCHYGFTLNDLVNNQKHNAPNRVRPQRIGSEPKLELRRRGTDR